MAKKEVIKAKKEQKKSKRDASTSLSEYKSGKSKLDEIFKSLKGKTTPSNSSDKEGRKDKEEHKATSKGAESVRKKHKSHKEEYTSISASGETRRRTEDNLPIYTVEELNIGKGGNTDECPFDCNCCF